MNQPERVLQRNPRELASDSLSDPDVAPVERTLELGVAVSATSSNICSHAF
jgi:hypothetical protein